MPGKYWDCGWGWWATRWPQVGRQRNNWKYVVVGHISEESGSPSVGAMWRTVTVPAWGRESSPLAPGRDAFEQGAALWPTPRGCGEQLVGYHGCQDDRRTDIEPTNGRAVALGGEAQAPGVTESVLGHPGGHASGTVAEGHPGPLDAWRTVSGGHCGDRPASCRRRSSPRAVAAGSRHRTPAPLGAGVPRRRGGDVHRGLERDSGSRG